jgi:hypothetical protein
VAARLSLEIASGVRGVLGVVPGVFLYGETAQPGDGVSDGLVRVELAARVAARIGV